MDSFRLTCAKALLVGAVGGIFSLPVQAHHSFAATYSVDRTVTVQGTVIDFLFRYPHAFVHVMAPDKAGQMVEWSIEWAAAGALTKENVTNATLKPGDQVVVTGSPARDESLHRIRMKAIIRPSDGWKWSGTFG